VSVSEAQQSLLNDLFAAIDNKDVDGFAKFLTADASFRFGSAPAAEGADAIREAVGGFFTSIKALEHSVTRAIAEDSMLFCEGSVTYTRHDGSTVTLPFADVFEMDGDRIATYKIYMDIAPLYAA
jgi:limonene-1,2-epoxide hydrolase